MKNMNILTTVDKNDVLALIKSSAGRIFTAYFTKKDGSTRKMNCRLGVTKGIKASGMNYNPAEYGLLTVYDVKAKGYRTINLNTVKMVTMNSNYYLVTTTAA